MYIIKRIQSEVIIGQKIKHLNIVDFVYFSETSNNIYIFMERCETYPINYLDLLKISSKLEDQSHKIMHCPSLGISSLLPAFSMIKTSLTGISKLRTYFSGEIQLNLQTLDSPKS